MLLPYIAVAVHRLHDTGTSGYYAFWMLLPPIGRIILLILCAMEGDYGENIYGPPPTGLPSR